MATPRTISLDAMGGDEGPGVVVPGAAIALERHAGVTFLLFGDEARIRPHLDRHPLLAARSRIVHTDTVVEMQDKPSQAVRRGRGSSMWLALDAVRKREADFMVSAGNTGALMAMAKLVLTTMPGIERPAIAGQWPTVNGACIVLDLGANIGATARQLADFALMGAAMARAVLHIERPRVGLLNIGVEEIKGIEEVRQAHAWLKESEPAHRLSRLHRGRSDRPGGRRCPGRGGFRRQHGAQDRGGHGQADGGLDAGGHDQLARGAAGRHAGTRGPARPEGAHGHAAVQRRTVPRPQRHCHQEPRRHRRRRASRRRSRWATRWPRATCSNAWRRTWKSCMAGWARRRSRCGGRPDGRLLQMGRPVHSDRAGPAVRNAR